MAAVAAMDFFTVPTVTFRLLYCFGHSLHHGLSAPPTASCAELLFQLLIGLFLSEQ